VLRLLLLPLLAANLQVGERQKSQCEGVAVMRLLILILGVFWLLPLQANTRYTQVAIEGLRFCGLSSDGQIECTAARDPQPLGLHDYPDALFTALELSDSFACGITVEGQIECWGVDSLGNQLSPPVFDHPVTSLSLAVHHACAVDNMGVAKCWGQDVHGQATAPSAITDFVDIESFSFYDSCGVRSSGEVVCWGRNSASLLPTGLDTQNPSPFVDIEYSQQFSIDHGCGIRADGSVDCWRRNDGAVIAQFQNGPYSEVFPLTPNERFAACALTVSGAVDCAEQSANIIRVEDTFQDVTLSDNYLYGYTTDDRLVTISNNIGGPLSDLLDIINGELTLPTLAISGGEFYGTPGTELFFNTMDTTIRNYRLMFDTQVFRDEELIATTDNLGSFLDRDPVPGANHVYTVRAVHAYGQVGGMSNAVEISAIKEEQLASDVSPVLRPFSPQNLRGEVYWNDVELFWDRDNTATVRHYEIRRDGIPFDTTRGISWYDNSSEHGKRYQYDVLAIGHDEAILGIESVQIQIGPAECR